MLNSIKLIECVWRWQSFKRSIAGHRTRIMGDMKQVVDRIVQNLLEMVLIHPCVLQAIFKTASSMSDINLGQYSSAKVVACVQCLTNSFCRYFFVECDWYRHDLRWLLKCCYGVKDGVSDRVSDW